MQHTFFYYVLAISPSIIYIIGIILCAYWGNIPWSNFKLWGKYRIRKYHKAGAELPYYNLETRICFIWVKLTWSTVYEVLLTYTNKRIRAQAKDAKPVTMFEHG